MAIHQEFSQALDALIEQVKRDRSILAAILCGSLSHDTVWAKSDIDLVLVTIDDKKVETTDFALNANGVNVHAILMPRTQFRKTVEGSIHNSFMHSFLAKGKLLYAHDPTIAELCSRLRDIGDRDTRVQLLRAATCVNRNFGIEGVTLACEYLADRNVIGKVSTAGHLTKKSNIEVEQLAFVYMEKLPDGL
jgi:predicted nucleotidyltransferase